MEDIKRFLWIAGVGMLAALIGFAVWFVALNMWVLTVFAVIVAMAVTGAIWLGFLWLQEKASWLVVRRQQHLLALAVSRDELEERQWRRGLEVRQLSERAVESRVVEEQPLQLASPREQYQTGLELYQSGKVPGRDIMLGYEMVAHGELWLSWKVLKGVLILGLSEGGKSSTGAWLLSQHVAQGGRFSLIDPHAAVDESMWSRVRALRGALVGDVANTTEKAVKMARKAHDIMRGRFEGDPDRTPYLLVVDEFTALMAEGGDVQKELTFTIKKLNAEGRKVMCYALCIGQATNADASGGTSVRDLFPTKIMHRMKGKQAQNLGQDKDEKAVIKQLGKGQVYVETDVHPESIAVQVPYAGEDVIALIGRNIKHASEPLQGHFREVSDGRKSQVLKLPEATLKSEVKSAVVAIEEDLPEKAQRVLKMLLDGMGKVKIIETVWVCKSGASKAYKQAVLEYEQIVASLVSFGYISQQ